MMGCPLCPLSCCYRAGYYVAVARLAPLYATQLRGALRGSMLLPAPMIVIESTCVWAISWECRQSTTLCVCVCTRACCNAMHGPVMAAMAREPKEPKEHAGRPPCLQLPYLFGDLPTCGIMYRLSLAGDLTSAVYRAATVTPPLAVGGPVPVGWCRMPHCNLFFVAACVVHLWRPLVLMAPATLSKHQDLVAVGWKLYACTSSA